MGLNRALPHYEAKINIYIDRAGGKVVAQCKCNKCGEAFTLSMRVNPYGLATMKTEQMHRAIFRNADQKHSCPEESFKQNPKETDRIINKYHEFKRKNEKHGLILPTSNPYAGQIKRAQTGSLTIPEGGKA